MPLSRVSNALTVASFREIDRPGVTDMKLSQDNLSLQSEIVRLRARILELERAADTDPLVPVFNRRAFMREVARAQTVMERYDMVSSVIFFDLNGFKAINDAHGHTVGDNLLKAVGDVLVNGVRQCDMVARLGGDEFGVLLFKSSPDIAQAKAAALSCRMREKRISTGSGSVSTSASWGVAPCRPGCRAEEILHQADQAMYQAKRGMSERLEMGHLKIV
jgi:diguanylate cyclase (GGDEF)-like protein